MRHCQFHDEPGKRSLCLRTLAKIGRWEDMRGLRMCDEDRNATCPHRCWSDEGRERALATRSIWLTSCPQCGRRHDDIRESLQCQADAILLVHLEPCADYQEKGSTVPLLADRFPQFIKERAWRKVRENVVKRDGNACQECGRDLTKYPGWYTEVHHIIPVIMGGGDHPANLITLCTECHGSHTDALLVESTELTSTGNSARKKKGRRYHQCCIHEARND